MSHYAEVFRRRVATGDLSEEYGCSVVTISCQHCTESWERGRRAHRAETIHDRDMAVQHLRQHGIDGLPEMPKGTR